MASRKCTCSGWSPPSFLACISGLGRELLFAAEELEKGRKVLAGTDLRESIDSLKAFLSGRGNITGGDVQVGGRALRALVKQLRSASMGNISDFEESAGGLIEGADLLLDSEFKEEWSVAVPASFSSPDFLFSLEELSRIVTSSALSKKFTGTNLVIKKEAWQPSTGKSGLTVLDIQTQRVSASVSPAAINATPPAQVIYTLLPTLGQLLPFRANFNISHMTLATPILSIQVEDMLGSEVTDVNVTMTLGFSVPLSSAAATSNPVCVSWSYLTR